MISESVIHWPRNTGLITVIKLFQYTYHGVMGFSDILQQGMSRFRTDGAEN